MTDPQARFQDQWQRLLVHWSDPDPALYAPDWHALLEEVEITSRADLAYLARILANVGDCPAEPTAPRTLGTWLALEQLCSRNTAILGAWALPQHPQAFLGTWADAPPVEHDHARQAWALFWAPPLRQHLEALWEAILALPPAAHTPVTDRLTETLERQMNQRLRLVQRGIPGCEPAHLGPWAGVLITSLKGSANPEFDTDAQRLAQIGPWVAPTQWQRWAEEGQLARWSARWAPGSALPAVWQAQVRAQALQVRQGVEGRSAPARSARPRA